MNFLDLYKKIQKIEEGASQGNMMPQAVSAPPSGPVVNECGAMGECGDMPMPGSMAHNEPPKQQDSVSMSVNMNANGAGGIRDLMDILKNLDKTIDGPHDDNGHDDIVIGAPQMDIDHVESEVAELDPTPSMEEPAPTAPPVAPMATDAEPVEEEVPEHDFMNSDKLKKIAAVSAVIGTGNDLSSKGKEAPKQAGGGNPWNVSESKIAANLSKHYAEVKSRTNEAYGRRPPLNPDKFGDANKIQGSWGKGDKYDSSGNYLGGGGDEYIGDPYGKKERERAADKDKGPWYINAGGKTLKVGGQPKVFDHIKPARAYIKAIKAKNPKFGDSIITRQPEEMSPLEFMRRHLNVKGFSSINNPGELSKYYRVGQYDHFYGPEGTEKLNLALKYLTALINDPDTDPETQQKAAADVESLKTELQHRAEKGTFN